ncbi:putative CONSERVED MEMBRANE domain protein [Mycobacterium kansasii 662]|uniref:Putative CONSERVED MEMBRANE domain protein n=1 Tax=Mycobacterium kansasii 662 TaxID=1299326 RepID=X7XUS4_MYCKA|nr:putative CONSERVED MEMBRANE domain protein [Mycobacterium kansasii 662]
MLDLEPRGPLPTEIYWRRRGLALGIAVVVIGIAVAAVVAFVGNTAGAKPVNAEKPGSAQSHPGSNAPEAPQPAGQKRRQHAGGSAGAKSRDADSPPPRCSPRRC